MLYHIGASLVYLCYVEYLKYIVNQLIYKQKYIILKLYTVF